MIIVGAYPDTFAHYRHNGTPLSLLADRIERTFPAEVAVHLLPFLRSDGDWGFAPNDWYAVDENLGSWDDVRRIGSARRLMVDGIYNHVGVTHDYVREFLAAPTADSEVIRGYRAETVDPEAVPRSPRGGPVLRPWRIAGENWLLWQTFSDYAVDIQLDHRAVRDAIEKQLGALRENSVWGVRVDAPAYYSTRLDPVHRHHPDSYRLARATVSLIRNSGFHVMAQLDCDEHGLRYFPPAGIPDLPIVDYAYSAHLVLALVSGSAETLAVHLRNTWTLPCPVIRAPRTHDGILLRSKLLPEEERHRLVEALSRHGVLPRSISGTSYEFNSSLPYLYGLGVDAPGKAARIELSIALSAILPGVCYLYLPAVLGFTPELQSVSSDSTDPRSLNRQPLPVGFFEQQVSTGSVSRIFDLLSALVTTRRGSLAVLGNPQDVVIGVEGVLLVERPEAGLRAVFNLHPEHTYVVAEAPPGDAPISRRMRGNSIGPLGFAVWPRP
ncbi:alpha-amylase family glycosyl hydrolase [Actinosynnema sp. CS-041913]|uniref:alpha-amylase family glycosyl hydrolase n=1 Tax=Actinosynnema sp. CS-041913 TaxID=3239917 RepID=UPI003D9141E9